LEKRKEKREKHIALKGDIAEEKGNGSGQPSGDGPRVDDGLIARWRTTAVKTSRRPQLRDPLHRKLGFWVNDSDIDSIEASRLEFSNRDIFTATLWKFLETRSTIARNLKVQTVSQSLVLT
jgi:hypothetical protein